MTRKKKILLSFTVAFMAVALVATGVFAYFIEYDWTKDDGRVGTVSVELSPINVSRTSVKERNPLNGQPGKGSYTGKFINESTSTQGTKKDTSDGIKIATWSYYNAVNDSTLDPSEYWLYNNTGGLKVNDLFFRTSYTTNSYASQALKDKSSVAYCVDPGLIATDSHFISWDGGTTIATNIKLDKNASGSNVPRELNDYKLLKESEKISDDVKRVLKVGFPNRNYSQYRLANSDAELEWATSVAIYIAEGAAYKTLNTSKKTGTSGAWKNEAAANGDKKEIRNNEFRLDRMELDERVTDQLMIPSAFFNPASEDAKEQELATAKRLKGLVADILEEADRVTSIPDFTLDGTRSIVTPLNEKGKEYTSKKKELLTGYLVGPFYLNNTIGPATFTITDGDGRVVDQTAEGVHLVASATSTYHNVETNEGHETGLKEDPDRVMDKIGKVEYKSPFYMYVPVANKYTSYTINARIDGEQYKNYPMYYYWSGNEAEQRMISCKKVAPTAAVKVSNAVYDECNYWNPGDVLTVRWNVNNTGTKSVVTRNIVSIYWEQNDINQFANHKDIVYLYPENCDSTDIYYDQFGIFPEGYKTSCMQGCSYRSLGSMAPVYVNGKKYDAGYSLVIYGDALDGVGYGAEIGDSVEQDYNSHYDEKDNSMDVVSFKMCLSSRANIHTMNKKLVIRVETQALQYRNTSNEDWDTVFRDSYNPKLTTGIKDPTDNGNANPPKWNRYEKLPDAKWEKYPESSGNLAGTPKWDSKWQTVGTQEYVIGNGSTSANEPKN